MNRFWLTAGSVLLFFLLVFGITVLLGFAPGNEVVNNSSAGSTLGALFSIGLLIADLLLPVPSSLIMIGNGAFYGVFLGSLLSLLGGLGALLVGYYLGSKGETIASRWLGPNERRSATAFFERWGILTVAISRPIPLLSETVAIMAGLAGWPLKSTIISAVAGLLPISIIYAWSGAYAANQDYGILPFLLVVGVSSIAWLVGRFFFAPKSIALEGDTPSSRANSSESNTLNHP